MNELKKICIKKTSDLIKSDYWVSYNPFMLYPMNLVHDIIQEMMESHDGHMETRHIKHLLTSSPLLTHLIIKDVELHHKILEDIFVIMSSSCEKIQRLELVNCQANPLEHNKNKRTYQALKNLILKSKNLKYIESSIYFDLNIIKNISGLHTLILHFLILESENSLEMIPKNSLKHFEVSKEETSETCLAISKIALQNFKELIYTNCCLTKAFESLHSEEFKENKTVTTKYKLKQCTLGKNYENGLSFASPDAIHIASVTCPNLEYLAILADDSNGLNFLSNFHKLKIIEIRFDTLENISVINDALKRATFSRNLKSLNIINAIELDFSVILSLCPCLHTLRLEFCNGKNSIALASKSFDCLHNLELILIDDSIIKDSLFIMLSYAWQLRSLKLSCIPRFDDDMFERVLRINPLTYLSTLHLINTGATKDGILSIKDNFESFKFCTSGLIRARYTPP